MHTYSILSVPFYDARRQQYTKILCINAVPVVGALAARVKTVRPPRLSGLCNSDANSNNKCIHALTSSAAASGSCSSCCDYLTPEELPELFAFLVTNGYTVDTGLTKLAAKHQPGGGGCFSNANANANANANSLVCIISYNSSK